MAKTDVNSTICITTGEPGAGKTLSRGVIYAVEVYLRDKIGNMYHNLPLKHEEIADYLFKKYKKDRTETLGRLFYIPEESTKLWIDNCFFEYFKDKDLHNAYVLIDEAHVYFGRNNLTGKADLIASTEKALSEFRHNGAKLELMTQSYKSIHKTVRDRAGYAISILNFQDYNDVIFGIKMRDWLQLKAKLTGQYTSASLQIENKISEDKPQKICTKVWWHQSDYYKMYNTHNAGEGSQGADTAKLKDDWQIRSWPALVWWFMRRNFFNLFIGSRISIIGWCLLFFILLGPKNLIVAWVKRVENNLIKTDKSKIGSETKKAADKKEEKTDDPELRLIKTKNDELQKKLDEYQATEKIALNKIKQDKSITLIDENGLMLYDGSYFLIGNEIDFGFLKGKKIEKIEVKQNRVFFSDGSIVNIGSSLFQSSEGGGSRISEPLQNESEKKPSTGHPKYTEIGEISNRGSGSTPASKLSSK